MLECMTSARGFKDAIYEQLARVGKATSAPARLELLDLLSQGPAARPARQPRAVLLLVVVNAFVGAMVGMERTILPAIAEQEFHLAAKTAVLSFIVVFGVTKALTNYLAGRGSPIASAASTCWSPAGWSRPRCRSC
jgi:hypothetical protein